MRWAFAYINNFLGLFWPVVDITLNTDHQSMDYRMDYRMDYPKMDYLYKHYSQY